MVDRVDTYLANVSECFNIEMMNFLRAPSLFRGPLCTLCIFPRYSRAGHSIFFDFVLKLPQTLVNAAAPVVSNFTSPLPNPVLATNTADELETLQFEFGNLEEDHFDSLSPSNMRALLKCSASVLVSTSSSALKKLKTNPSTYFGVTTSSTTPITQELSVTPKMDQVFASSAAGVVSTYTGAFEFLENGNQAIFASIFGTTPTPIIIEAAKKEVRVENIYTLWDKIRSFVSLVNYLFL